MGQAISQVSLQENIYSIVHTPINKYFIGINQFLELRQETANRLSTAYNIDEKSEKGYYAMIDYCNEQILKILNIKNQ